MKLFPYQSIMLALFALLGAATAPAGAALAGDAAQPQAAGECLQQAKSLPKSGNQIVDTRCALVAFEVCMQAKTGLISQSQDAPRQCAMIQALGGASACQATCLAATGLVKGGTGVIDRYTGLSSEAVSCYERTMDSIGGGSEKDNECIANHALECLQNASALPAVNAAIVRERRSSCSSFHARHPQGGCSACHQGKPRVDYEAQKLNDIVPGMSAR